MKRILIIVAVLGAGLIVRADDIPTELPVVGTDATIQPMPARTDSADESAINIEANVESGTEADFEPAVPDDGIAPILFDRVRKDHTIFELAPKMAQSTWILGGKDKLGMFSLQSRDVWEDSTEGLQFLSGYGIHFVDGPTRTDLPPRLFDFHLGMRWAEEVNESWAYELAVTPGIYSDFEGSARNGIRVPAHGIVFFGDKSLRLALGAVYLDRRNLGVLPVVGVIYEPDDSTRFDLVFPKPKIARRVRNLADSQQWLFVMGELGGGEWAIERASGRDDVVTYNDLRLVIGLETLSANSNNALLEFGYVFGRDLEYRSGIGNYEPSSTWFIRWGSSY